MGRQTSNSTDTESHESPPFQLWSRRTIYSLDGGLLPSAEASATVDAARRAAALLAARRLAHRRKNSAPPRPPWAPPPPPYPSTPLGLPAAAPRPRAPLWRGGLLGELAVDAGGRRQAAHVGRRALPDAACARRRGVPHANALPTTLLRPGEARMGRARHEPRRRRRVPRLAASARAHRAARARASE